MGGNPNITKHGVKFGEGQDPTKGGAPKGKRVSTILRELLSKNAKDIGIDKIKESLPEGTDGNTALALELLTLAFGGGSDKLSSIKEVLDRIEGKAVQTVLTDTPPDQVKYSIVDPDDTDT